MELEKGGDSNNGDESYMRDKIQPVDSFVCAGRHCPKWHERKDEQCDTSEEVDEKQGRHCDSQF